MKLPGLRLRLATSQLIRQWAQRRLPNGKIISGQIFNPKTINYQTLKPEKDGLFCERIFGPINDSICACGRPFRGQKFCPRCEVEYISTRVRRYRLGYIQLITATAHIWFFKGRPSYLSLFLNLSKKKIECLLYCTRNISRTLFPQELSSLNFYSIQKFNNVEPIKRQLWPSPLGKRQLRNCVSKNWILWSFFLERGYWNFQKIPNVGTPPEVRDANPVPGKPSAGMPREGRRFIQRAIQSVASPNDFLVIDWACHRAKLAAGQGPDISGPAGWGPRYFCRSISRHGRYTSGKSIGGPKVRRSVRGPSRLHRNIRTFVPPEGLLALAPLSEKAPSLPWGVGEVPKKLGRPFPWIGPAGFAKGEVNSNITKPAASPVLNELGLPLNQYQLGSETAPQKSRWKEGGLRDSAVYFGFSLVSKMFSWQRTAHWFSFVYFLIQSPFCGDFLNKFYPGPPGLVNFWGLESRLFCSTGVQLMRTWLTQLTQNQCYDGRLLEIQIRLDLLRLECEPTTVSENAFIQRIVLFRRFKYLRSFRHTQMNPASMILSVIPVLPPDLRPILQLDNNQMAVSDLNKLYQTVLLRNKRLFKLTRLTMEPNSHCLNSEALQYSQRLLQESVDSLIDNGKVSSSRQATARQAIPLKSLSDLFKGKKGRFRQNLLGKRVDYSGRSVIVVGPYLKIYECGLPKEIAYELFQPFLLRILMLKNQAQTILGAKKLLQQKPLFIWSLLKEVVHSHPILLNRAPSLHRLSIQAFQPRLIEGKAILLHPLVCAAFNADFDGDQMGVHLPLCFEARGEAWKITWSQNNLFSVATGSPTCSPSQDMILGSTFLTMENTQKFGFNLLKEQTLKKFNPKTGLAFTSKGSGIVHKILMSAHLMKRLLFEKPYFFVKKNINLTTSSDYFNKKNNLSETTLPMGGLPLSFSQNSHPFIYLNFLRVKPFGPAGWTDGTSQVGERAIRPGSTLGVEPWCFFRRPCLYTPVLHRFAMSRRGLRASGRRVPGTRGRYIFPQSRNSASPSGRRTGSRYILELHPFEKTNNVFMRNLSADFSVERPVPFGLNDSIWCSCNPSLNKFETEKKKQKLIEIRINSRGQFQKFRSQFCQQYHSSGVELLRKIRTTYGRIQFFESLALFE